MNVLFAIKNEIYSAMEPLGILYLSGVLKKNGHNVFLSDYSFNKIRNLIVEKNIGILAFSCVNTDYRDYLNLSRKVKKSFPELLIVFGGPTPTYNPEIINQEPIDIVCRGEGEIALLELVNRLDCKQNIHDIQNLWVKIGSMIYKNDVRPLLPIDSLPFPDRSLTNSFSQFRYSPIKFVMASRGCPFDCTFCFNYDFRRLYQNKGEIIRTRSVDNVIEELEKLRTDYKVKFFYFLDDIFPFKNEWLVEFSEKYSRKIKIPFTIITSVALVNESFIGHLKRAGCVSLHLAIESANEKIRREILNKRISNDKIREAFKTAKEEGFTVCSYNMVGIPFSKFEDDLETLDFNLELKADVSLVFFCLPFPNTKLGKISIDAGLISERTEFLSYFESMPVRINGKKRLEKFSYIFPIVVSYPFLRPYLFILLRIPLPKIILKLLKDIINGYNFKKRIIKMEISFKEFLLMAYFFLLKRFSK